MITVQNMIAIKKLDQSWVDAEPKDESNEEFALALLAHIHARLELTRPICPKLTAEKQLLEIKELLLSLNTWGPEYSRDEAFYRRLYKDPSSGIQYLSKDIEQKSKQQSMRARKGRPRRKDGITPLIEAILEENPGISAKEVGKKLLLDNDIELFEGEYRHKIDASTLKDTNLPSRVSDAKGRRPNSFSG